MGYFFAALGIAYLLVTSRLETTRHVRRVEQVEMSVPSRAVPTWWTTNKL